MPHCFNQLTRFDDGRVTIPTQNPAFNFRKAGKFQAQFHATIAVARMAADFRRLEFRMVLRKSPALGSL
jgi:hypothetical protein